MLKMLKIAAVFLGVSVLAGVGALKVVRPKFTSLNEWSDSEYLDFTFKVDMSVPYVNFTFNVLKEIKDIAVHFEAVVAQKNDPTYFLVTNTTFNLCKLLALRDRSSLGMLAYSFLSGYGHLAQSCPIKRDTYTIHRFWIPEEQAQPEWSDFTFTGKLQADAIDAKNNKKRILDNSWAGHSVVIDVPKLNSGILNFLKF